MSLYPGVLDVFANNEAKKDKVSAADMNAVQDAIEAIEAELGTDPAGSLTTLVARLAVALADNGAMQQGTSFPVSGLVDGQMFYRTDENVMYIYNGATWDAQGQSLSAIAFSFALGGDFTVDQNGMILDDALEAAGTLIQKGVWAVEPSTDSVYSNVIKSKFKKLAGVNTVTCYARIWGEGPNAAVARVRVDIGGQNGVGTATQSQHTPEEVDFTIDVSGLTDGVTYDLEIDLTGQATNSTYMDSIIGFGS